MVSCWSDRKRSAGGETIKTSCFMKVCWRQHYLTYLPMINLYRRIRNSSPTWATQAWPLRARALRSWISSSRWLWRSCLPTTTTIALNQILTKRKSVLFISTRWTLNIDGKANCLQFQAPKYLGVTVDHIPSFKKHCTNTKAKVSTRNNNRCCQYWKEKTIKRPKSPLYGHQS